MTGPVSPPAQPRTYLPAPRRPTHESLSAIADLVAVAIQEARSVLTEVAAVPGPGDDGQVG